MRRALRLFFSLIVILFTGFAYGQTKGRLPALAVEGANSTVSGISAGGFMAVQIHVALSSEFSGAGVVAGGVYWCTEGNVLLSSNPCMLFPWLVNAEVRVEKARLAARRGGIDPTQNLARSRVYIYGSPIDPVIHISASTKLHEFYTSFVDESRILHRHDILASHGFPTRSYGAPCSIGGYPWMLNCGFDLAGEMLSQMYGALRAPAGEAIAENLRTFNQREFASAFTGLSTLGHVYVPTSCSSGEARCRVHVALHGCGMSPVQVGNAFIEHAGYNRWAEANDIVVLYPAVAPTFANPGACWDWWGYTGASYVEKSGPQIRAIKAMVDRLKAGPPSPSKLTSLDANSF